MIQTEFTPNPNSLKFNVGKKWLEQGSLFFSSKDQGQSSPLVKEIFEIPHVINVMVGADFLTVTRKDENETWQAIIKRVSDLIEKYLSREGEALFSAEKVQGSRAGHSDVEQKIIQVLDSYIRPSIAKDGGDITFHGYENGKVTLHLRGACSTCPSSTATLKGGVERMLREYIPEVSEVVQINA